MTETMLSSNERARLASEWYAAYRREALTENGDPEAFVAGLRETVDFGLPESNATRAFAALLERIREEDLDVATDR